jgi:hypothetical protein
MGQAGGMLCPSGKCGSSNVQHLPHYWESLPADSPLKARYAQPAVEDGRGRLILALVAAAGVVLLVTGTVALGLLALAAGAIGAWVAHGRIVAAETKRAAWSRSQICLACTHQWTP